MSKSITSFFKPKAAVAKTTLKENNSECVTAEKNEGSALGKRNIEVISLPVPDVTDDTIVSTGGDKSAAQTGQTDVPPTSWIPVNELRCVVATRANHDKSILVNITITSIVVSI